MTEQQLPKNQETAYIYDGKVYVEQDGSIYLLKVITVKKWDNFFRKYVDASELSRQEKVTPAQMGYTRTLEDKILIAKKIQSEDSLTDTETVFEMELRLAFPEEAQYKYQYFYRCSSGQICVKDFSSGCCFPVGVNSAYISRGKTIKLPENTLIPKTRQIYTLNSSGELELRLDSSNPW